MGKQMTTNRRAPSGRAPVKKVKKKKKSTKTKVINVVSVLVIIACIGSMLYLGYQAILQQKLLEDDPTLINSATKTDVAFKKDVSYFLITGRDLSDMLTDVIMVACFDQKNKSVSILQIPRDTYIGDDIPTGKINAVYGHPKNGMKNMEYFIQRVHEELGVPIDYYVSVSLDGFKNIVDEIGGLEVYVPKHIKFMPGMELEKGLQQIDGEKAEWIVRTRKGYALGDVDRVEMQKYFMAALVKKIVSMDTGSLVGLVPTLANEVKSNMTLGEMLSLSKMAKSMNMQNMKIFTLPGEPYSTRSYSYYSAYMPEARILLNNYFMPYGNKLTDADMSLEELAPQRSSEGIDRGGNLEDYTKETTSSSSRAN